MRTSVLDRMTAPLCDAVLDRPTRPRRWQSSSTRTCSSSRSTIAAAGTGTTIFPRHAPGRARAARARPGPGAQRARGDVVRGERDAGLGGPTLARGRGSRVGERARGHERRSVHPQRPRRDRRAVAARVRRHRAARSLPCGRGVRNVHPRAARTAGRAPTVGRPRWRTPATTARCRTGAARRRPWAALVRALLCKHGVGQYARRRGARDRRARSQEPVAAHGVACSAALRCLFDGDRADSGTSRSTSRPTPRRSRTPPTPGDRELRARAGRTRPGRLDGGGTPARAARRLVGDDARGGVRRGRAPPRREREDRAGRGRGAAARQDLVGAQTRAARCSPARSPGWRCRRRSSSHRSHLALEDGDGARTLCLEAEDVLQRTPDVGTLGARAAELRS